jgi:hypothetical protein
MSRAFATFLLAAALFAAAPAQAGRDAPILNVTDTPVAWLPGVEQSTDKVARAIITACARLGWVCSIAEPGEITGRLNLRSHQADVRIPYSTEKYSILYVSSENLRYDAAENTIHRNYNNWVLNLQRQINAELAATT